MPGKLQRNARGLGDFGMVGCVCQQNARTVAIQTDAVEGRRQRVVAPRIPVRHTNNLQTVYLHFFIVEHTHPSRCNGLKVFTVIPKLLMIPRNEIHAVRRR